MDLQGNKSSIIQAIYHKSCWHTIHPSPGFIADSLDPVVGEFIWFICRFRIRVEVQRVQPFSTTFIIDSPGPSSSSCVDVHLATIDPSSTVVGGRIKV